MQHIAAQERALASAPSCSRTGQGRRLWQAAPRATHGRSGVAAPIDSHTPHPSLQNRPPARWRGSRLRPKVTSPHQSETASAGQEDSSNGNEAGDETPSAVLRRRHANNAALTDAELESLDVLEWGAVSRQVARLCGTSMAAQHIAIGGLPLGTSPEHSATLLQQTMEAADLQLSVQGVYDLTPALDVLALGGYLNAKQLEGVAATLDAALRLKAQAQLPAEGEGREQPPAPRHPALAALAEGIQEEEAATLRAIRHCIKLGSVSDEASEALAAVRAQRRDNVDKLRRLMEDIARALFAKGASDSRSVTLIRDRYCVGIKAGRQSDLPKGSVKLSSSQTGATMYYEPAPAIALNNAAALLAAQEKEAEDAILVLLSRLVASRSEAIRGLLAAATSLDIVAARARHARVFSARPPELVTMAAAGSVAGALATTRPASLVWVPGALHPVLLEQALPEPLPDPPSLDDNSFDRDFGAAAPWEVRRSPLGAVQAASSAAGLPAQPRSAAPQALDLRLPPGKRVVAITGPNTGGKTVTLKTVGLLALMARAGLFIPIAQGASPGGEEERPRVAWFDRVLADIGDAQSLQQSLSTFSGHIRRIKQVLGAALPGSLVLMDEVGSGTDPVEGAALARAILDHLAGRAALTVATTHHAELKQVDAEDGRYTNVSMEFDVVSLRPTYRLLWGAAGASNALTIAAGLGFDSSIVKDAEAVAQSTFEYQADREARQAATAASLVKQLEDTRAELAEARERRHAAEAEVEHMKAALADLTATNEALMRAPKQIVKRRDAVRAALEAAIAAFEAGEGSREAVDAIMRQLEHEARNKIALATNQAVWHEAMAAVGDRVVVPGRFGEDTHFTVASIQDGATATLVPCGAMGAGLQLLTLGGTASRQRKGTSLKVPLSDVRVVQRAVQANTAAATL